MASSDALPALSSVNVHDNVAPLSSALANLNLATSSTHYEERPKELGDLLARLPPELISMVLDSLIYADPSIGIFNRAEERRFLSRSSLVCREWSSIQRPRLFEELKIPNSDELRFLMDVLRHPKNGWMSTAIKRLTLSTQGPASSSLDRSCRLLTGKLPSLRHFYILQDTSEPKATHGVSIRSLQSFFDRHKSLSRLELWSIKFFSFSALVHALQNLTGLEDLELLFCSWACPDDRTPTRLPLSSFPKLHSVQLRHSSHHLWMIAWLLAPLLARRREDVSEDATANNSDTLLLVLLVKSCCTAGGNFEALKLEYDEEWNLIAIDCLGESSSGWRCQYGVTLLPSASVPTNGQWSAIRDIACNDTGDRPIFDKMDWKVIDKALARDATKLENMHISTNEGWATLPTRLPELSALNRLSVEDRGELASPYEDHDGYADERDDADDEETTSISDTLKPFIPSATSNLYEPPSRLWSL